MALQPTYYFNYTWNNVKTQNKNRIISIETVIIKQYKNFHHLKCFKTSRRYKMATPDDRREKIMDLKEKIHQTMNSIERTDELIANTDNPSLKDEMKKKNEERFKNIRKMQDDINDQNQPAE